MAVRLKRIHDPADDGDGYRVLVDRLWPRGVGRAAARLDAWLREVAPSGELRRWFGHDPARWGEFRRRYLAELKAHREGLRDLAERTRRGRVTLLFGARDEEHNNAVVLRQYLRLLGGK